MTTLKITNQAYNREIKQLFEAINKKMKEDKIEVTFRDDYGSHSGRDSFVTMCVNKGVDWKTILGWVGQSSFKIMARYYGLNDKYQEEKMKKIVLN
jgi:integrase